MMHLLHDPYSEIERRRERVTMGIREQGRVRRLASGSEPSAPSTEWRAHGRALRGLVHRLVPGH